MLIASQHEEQKVVFVHLTVELNYFFFSWTILFEEPDLTAIPQWQHPTVTHIFYFLFLDEDSLDTNKLSRSIDLSWYPG